MEVLGIILAAGRGTRFKSDRPKVIHRLLGKPMLFFPYNALTALNPIKVAVVVGHRADLVREEVESFPKVEFFYQENPKGGTGDAVSKVIPLLERYPESATVILNGDSPLIRPESLKAGYEKFSKENLDGLVFTAVLENPTGYGRIVRDPQGRVKRIVEEKDASEGKKAIKEVNGGFYIFKTDLLLEALRELKPSPITGEVYLTDVVEILYLKGRRVDTFALPPEEIFGVNDRIQLSEAERILLRRKIESLQREGITVRLPETVYIEWDVSVGKDSEIEPHVSLKGNTKVGEKTFIGQGSIIENSEIGRGVRILPYSFISDSVVRDGAVVGPFARIRNGSILEEKSEIGNFVEVKASRIGEGVKAKHLAYIGDASVGKESNIGAGTIFANYDGKQKHKTEVGEKVFIGSNSLIIAPRRLGSESFVAGGSIVNKDVPERALAIGRAKLRILNGKNPLLKKRDKG